MENGEISRTEEMLLAVLPHWNYRIAKPFKQILNEGVSLEMYYCVQTLRCGGGMMTMSELAQRVQMPKQQMTKMVNRLVKCRFVERVYDSADRRIIRIRVTDRAQDYVDRFLRQDAGCFCRLLEQMGGEDRAAFGEAISTILRILSRLPAEAGRE